MTEDQLQITCADYLRWKHPGLLFCHIPNGGSRNKIEAAKLKKMGVKSGMPDVFIPKPKEVGVWVKTTDNANLKLVRYLGFYSELKVKPNKPTPIQLDVMKQLSDLGYYICVCYTLDEFIAQVEGYLSSHQVHSENKNFPQPS